jgi:transposase
LFEEDECWFSRFAQPTAHAWAEPGQEMRLVEREAERGEQKALACYGAVRHDNDQVYLYCSEGQPNSQQTLVFVSALLDIARREGKRMVIIIWDNASWHKSRQVGQWIRAHNQQARRHDDVRLLVYRLPTRSPWLNPMEPRWVHAKRQVCEPASPLSVCELQRRLHRHFGTEFLVH